MRIVKASAEIYGDIDGDEILKKIERIGRVCYKSENSITDDSARSFVANIIKRGHESVLEHASVTVKFIVDRGVSHEIVRHRLASYCQSSTRYCNYSQGKFGGEITCIKPIFFDDGSLEYEFWRSSCENAETAYLALVNDYGRSPQEARSVLPNSLKTELYMTANLREWRHFFKLRTSKAAHPQMREVAIPLLEEFNSRIPVVFSDLEIMEG